MNLPLERIGRGLAGGLFLWAGAVKIVAPVDFLVSLFAYQLPLPTLAIRLLATTVPWLEVLIGGLLIANRWTETVRPLFAALCFIFVAVLVQAALRGLPIDCGCLGSSAPTIFSGLPFALVRAGALFAFAWWLCTRPLPTAKTRAID